MSINWDMAGRGNNALAYFQLGQQLGQQVIDGRVNRAVGKIMQADQPGQMPNGQAPDLSGEWETVARYNPEMAFKMKQRQAEQAEVARKRQDAEREARRARAADMAKLFDGVTPENYGQRLQIAQRMGIDTTGAPQVYDPNWVQENALITRFAAEKPEALSTFGKIAADEGKQPGTPEYNARVTELVKADALKTISYEAGGGVAGLDTLSGTVRTIVAPNPGGFAAGTPVGTPPPAASPPPAAIDYLRKNPTLKAEFDAKYGPGAADRVLGGQPAGNPPFGG